MNVEVDPKYVAVGALLRETLSAVLHPLDFHNIFLSIMEVLPEKKNVREKF